MYQRTGGELVLFEERNFVFTVSDELISFVVWLGRRRGLGSQRRGAGSSKAGEMTMVTEGGDVDKRIKRT